MNSELQYQFNKQINAEIYSAYLYLAMTSAAAAQGASGAAHWLMRQYHEEMAHAMKLITCLGERSATVRFYNVDAPPEEFGAVNEIFARVLAHEQHVTKLVHSLAQEAEYAQDAMARDFLQWFIDEQVEEEETAQKIVNAFQEAADDPAKLAALDRLLAARA